MFRYSVQFLLLLLSIFNIIQLSLPSEKYSVTSVDYVGKLVKNSINSIEPSSDKSVNHILKIIEYFKSNILKDDGIDIRIVGGKMTKRNEIPSIVAILVDEFINCGGTLIKSNFIVTAAHCANNIPSVYTIRAGSIYWNKGGYISKVSDIYRNPNYNSNTLNADIAIMKLKPGFGKYLYKESIALAPFPKKPAYKLKGCIVAGWGTANEKTKKPQKILKKLRVIIIKNKKCNKLLDNQLTKTMICATGSFNGNKDHCFGDSGGPLYCKGKLSGIISWAYGCGRPDSPGVYTNVYYMRKWIRNSMNRLKKH